MVVILFIRHLTALLESITILQTAGVAEKIIATSIRLDETKTFLVEPTNHDSFAFATTFFATCFSIATAATASRTRV